jgi:hypothetical protein
VLMLMPAGVLVVLVLGAVAFDMSVVFLRQRQASALAVDVANDVVTAALDEDAFRSGDDYRLDPERATDLGRAFVAASDLRDEIVEVEITVVADDAVEVRIVMSADYVFAKAIPGTSDGTTVEASATAVAVQG